MSNTLASGLMLVSIVSGGVSQSTPVASLSTFGAAVAHGSASVSGNGLNTATFSAENLLATAHTASVPLSTGASQSLLASTPTIAVPLSTGGSGNPPFPSASGSVVTHNFIAGTGSAASGFFTSFTSAAGALGTGSPTSVNSLLASNSGFTGPATGASVTFATGTADAPPTATSAVSSSGSAGSGGFPGSFNFGDPAAIAEVEQEIQEVEQFIQVLVQAGEAIVQGAQELAQEAEQIKQISGGAAGLKRWANPHVRRSY